MLLAEALTEQVIGLAVEVHRHTGPGLLETVYEQCLCLELRRAKIGFARQVVIPVLYKGEQVGDGFKADIVVAQTLILEIKSVGAILPVHEMQLRTYFTPQRHSHRSVVEFQRTPPHRGTAPLRGVSAGIPSPALRELRGPQRFLRAK